MRYFWFLFLISLLSCAKSDFEQKLVDEIEQLQLIYAPDKRTAIFNVHVEKSGNSFILKGETLFREAVLELKSFLDQEGIEYIDSIMILPQGLAGLEHGVVRLSACNIRTHPKHSAELATQSTLGTPLKIWKRDGNWYYVQTPDEYLGWLDGGGMLPMDAGAYDLWMHSKKVVFTKIVGHAYEEPDLHSQKISDLLAGNLLLDGDEDQEGFTLVGFPDGRQGFVLSNDIMPYDAWILKPSSNGENILSTAKEYLGTPYLWGGTSAKAFDCSGYTKTVYYLNGYILPRDASQQVHVGLDLGPEIDFQNWENGDLLFFGRKATEEKTERITHVSIYVGDGKMIHASGRVKIESLRKGDPDFTQYRYDSFIRAKRVLGQSNQQGIQEIQMHDAYKLSS
jgi:hypothetical protein